MMGSDYWFKPKSHGYGAAPANWKGWAAMFAYAAVLIAGALLLLQKGADGAPPSGGRVLLWIAFTAAVTVAFVKITRARTDGEWRWRWGRNVG